MNVIIVKIICLLVSALATFCLFISIRRPPRGSMQVISLRGTFYMVISNIPGYRINNPRTVSYDPTIPAWDKVPLKKGETGRWINLFFLPIWFFQIETYEFTYTKVKNVSNLKEDDKKIWDIDTTECIIERTNMSDHFMHREEYATVTKNLDLRDLKGKLHMYTNVAMEIFNAKDALYETKSYMRTTRSSFDGQMGTLVRSKSLTQVNKIKSEGVDSAFESYMELINKSIPAVPAGTGTPPTPAIAEHIGLDKFGTKISKITFIDWKPADEATELLAATYLKVDKAKQDKKIKITEAEATAAETNLTGDATNRIEMEKLIRTGKLKVEFNADGSIKNTTLIPDANTKITAENQKAIAEQLAKLAKVKGTLVLGDGVLNTLNLKK
ncbi:MAG: hypothetical protein NTZ44_01695 [Candidatus Nomurabacteria bacterium]|nr:hypothetical protein [Candidatus Nomurabacteria bacterium]